MVSKWTCSDPKMDFTWTCSELEMHSQLTQIEFLKFCCKVIICFVYSIENCPLALEVLLDWLFGLLDHDNCCFVHALQLRWSK